MKKIIVLMLITLVSITSNFVNVSASTEEKTDEELLVQETLDFEIEKMQIVFDNHYLIDCDSNESKNSFKEDENLTELYKETCKSLKKSEDDYSGVTFMNPYIDLVSSYMDYDLTNDLFYNEIIEKINEVNLDNQDLQILQLGKFYFNNNFEINTLVIDEIDSILGSDESTIMLMSATYGSWFEYSRSINYAKQWASSSLYNVDKV